MEQDKIKFEALDWVDVVLHMKGDYTIDFTIPRDGECEDLLEAFRQKEGFITVVNGEGESTSFHVDEIRHIKTSKIAKEDLKDLDPASEFCASSWDEIELGRTLIVQCYIDIERLHVTEDGHV